MRRKQDRQDENMAEEKPGQQNAATGGHDAQRTRTDLPAITEKDIRRAKKLAAGHDTQEIDLGQVRRVQQDAAQDTGARKAAKPDTVWPKRGKSRLVRAIGDILYQLGFAAEYQVVRAWRVLRDALAFFGQISLWVLQWLGRHIAAVARSIWKDLTAPLARFNKRRAQLRRARERARNRAAKGEAVSTYFGQGVKSSFQLLLNIVGVMMPMAAALILAVTVYNVVTMDYALAVEINGEVLGYVTDQSVVENAKGLLRDRIRLARNQEVSDWQLTPTYSISRANSFTTTHQLVNEILRTGAGTEGDIVQATGFYLNNELFAVTTEGERLRSYLDGLLARYALEERPDAQVSFVLPVECEPNEEDVYFASSVESYDELVKKLQQNVAEERRHVTSGEESLADIALGNDITLYDLFVRNPQLEGQEDDFIPEAGADLLIARAQPLLQVQVSYREQSVEPVHYATVEVENDQLMKGVRRTTQTGQDGLQEVWDDYYFIDGELARRERVEELTVVVVEVVDEIIEVGTKEPERLSGVTMPEGGYGGYYIFPVPGSPYSSRGMSGYHRGLDINAPAGSPIYACEGGTVVVSGWHYSYGNYIVIEHPGGVTTLYAHCSALFVSAGQQVSQGTHIAAVGSTGDSTGNHCHLEVTVGGARVDPVSFVGYPY